MSLCHVIKRKTVKRGGKKEEKRKKIKLSRKHVEISKPIVVDWPFNREIRNLYSIERSEKIKRSGKN